MAWSSEYKKCSKPKSGLLHLLLFRKWCFEFGGQNPNQNRPKFEGFGAGKSVQENNCFIGQGLVLYILHQICRLTVKQAAKGFDIFPRYTNACPQLLNSGLTEQFFFSDLVCGDAFLFQCGKHIHFVSDSHIDTPFL
jgi:hypothetical protein